MDVPIPKSYNTPDEKYGYCSCRKTICACGIPAKVITNLVKENELLKQISVAKPRSITGLSQEEYLRVQWLNINYSTIKDILLYVKKSTSPQVSENDKAHLALLIQQLEILYSV